MNSQIKLPKKSSSEISKIGKPILADGMNDLLSDYNIFNQNVKGFHWNFIGPDFFDLHQKLEDLNEKLTKDINKLADAIALTGFVPLHSYTDYLRYSNHKEIIGVNTTDESVLFVIDGLKKLILSINKTSNHAAKAKDINSEKILRQFSSELENELWVFTMIAKY